MSELRSTEDTPTLFKIYINGVEQCSTFSRDEVYGELLNKAKRKYPKEKIVIEKVVKTTTTTVTKDVILPEIVEYTLPDGTWEPRLAELGDAVYFTLTYNSKLRLYIVTKVDLHDRDLTPHDLKRTFNCIHNVLY